MIQQFSCVRGTTSRAASSTFYYRPAAYHWFGFATDTTQAKKEMKLSRPAVFSRLGLFVLSNDRGTSTATLLVNSVAGNMSLSLTATGWYEDVTNVDSVTTNDLVCVKLVTGAGGTTFVETSATMLCQYSEGEGLRYLLQTSNDSSWSADGYTGPVAAQEAGVTTEAQNQQKFWTAGTLEEFKMYVGAVRSSNTTVALRKGGVNTAISISVTGTGWWEDTSTSVSTAADDLISYIVDVAGGSGSFQLNTTQIEWKPTDGVSGFIGSGTTSAAFGINAGSDLALHPNQGSTSIATASEAQVQALYRTAVQLQKIRVYASANTLGGGSTATIALRKNGVNTSVSISITSGTGWFEDVSAGVYATVASGDLLSRNYVATAGSGTLTVKTMLVESLPLGIQRLVDRVVQRTARERAARW